MSLAEKLDELRNVDLSEFPADTNEKMHRAINELRDSGIMQRALNIGDKMPVFELPNTKGVPINSADLLKQGNLVVTFYRGYW